MQKNVASQKWAVFAFDSTNNTAKTGDAAQITGSIWIDGVENAIDDTNPTELAHGIYIFDIAQAETNGNYLVMDAVSSTSNIKVIGLPGAVWTTPPNFPTMGIESDGHVHGDLKQWLGVAPLALVSQRPQVDVRAKGDSTMGLTTQEKADVDTEADEALTNYDPPTKTELDSGLAALNDITVAQIIAGIADGSYDLQEMLRLIFAACCLKSTGGGTTSVKFRDGADGKDRISATVDANGNRTAVTLDGS